jgi:hypothetical protein
MFTVLQVGAAVLACAYLLLMWWPRRGRWARQLALRAWTVAFAGGIVFALAFLAVGFGADSKILMLSGIVMGAAAALAHDGYWAAESYQRRWGEC